MVTLTGFFRTRPTGIMSGAGRKTVLTHSIITRPNRLYFLFLGTYRKSLLVMAYTQILSYAWFPPFDRCRSSVAVADENGNAGNVFPYAFHVSNVILTALT